MLPSLDVTDINAAGEAVLWIIAGGTTVDMTGKNVKTHTGKKWLIAHGSRVDISDKK